MRIKPFYLILISLVVIASCSPQSKSDLDFNLSLEETLSAIRSGESLISPNEVLQLTKNGQFEYQLVDLRPPSEFVKGALNGAINIPVQHLFEAENLKLISDESYTTIFYGNNQLEANGPWLLLQQLGYAHLKVMQGGYHFIQSDMDSTYVAELARYDYRAVFNMAVKESEAALKVQSRPKRIAPKKIIPQKKKVEKVEKVEEEEEEGC